jgi:2-dehydropantoate 2-reductase
VATGLASLLSASGLEEVSVSADIRADVWDKALGNIGINALGAITGLRNGELVGNTWTAAVMQALVHEAECVARQGGLHLEPAWPRVQDLARRTAGNRNSMLQDLEAGRPTEIEFMNGAVVRMAEAAGLSAPVNACVANLVRGLEAAGVHRGSGRGTDCRRESTRSAAP